MSARQGTPEDVRRLATLARINIPEEKLSAFASEFDTVLAYVGTLNELELSIGTERRVPAVRNVLREDTEPTPSGTNTKKIVAQFPERSGNSLVVKQIISHD